MTKIFNCFKKPNTIIEKQKLEKPQSKAKNGACAAKATKIAIDV